MRYNTLFQLGTVLPGLPGLWYTAPEPGMDCNALCGKLGGDFDPAASQHNGSLAGSYFYPDNTDIDQSCCFEHLAVECTSMVRVGINYGANGEVPTGSEKTDNCYVHCACSNAPEAVLPINFQKSSANLDEWLVDNGSPFGDRATCKSCPKQEFVRYGWRCGSSKGTLGVDHRESVEQHLASANDYTAIDNTGVIPDAGWSCPEEEWNLEVPDGSYEVQVVIFDWTSDRNVAGCTLEGLPLGVEDVRAGEAYTATLNVRVTDGNITFAGSASSGCEFVNRIIVRRQPRRTQTSVTLAGDYAPVVEANGKENFLAACSAALEPAACDDVEGSIVLTLGVDDNEPYVKEVAQLLERDGLAIEGFPMLGGLLTEECTGLNPEDLNGGGTCSFQKDRSENNCQVYVYNAGNMTCRDWCRGQGRTALTGGWQCQGGFELLWNRKDPNVWWDDGLYQYDCVVGYPLGCDEPSGFDHLICRCEDRSPVNEVQDVADSTLEAILANFSNTSGTSIRVESEKAIVVATVLTAEAADDAGGSLTVRINDTLVAVEVPSSAISQLGGTAVLLVSAYSSFSMEDVENETLLDRRNKAVPFLGKPVSVQLATQADGFVEVANLQEPITITVPRQIIDGVSWDCAFYDEATLRWTTAGVDKGSQTSEFLVCSTRHLTLFAALGEPFIEALRCSNWNLLSMEGLGFIGQGSWAHEPAALLFWLVCLFHVLLFAWAIRTDLLTREEGRWTDRDFLRVQPALAATSETASKGLVEAISAKEKLQEKPLLLPKRGEFSSWLRARVNAYCIKQIVSYRMWISPCNMEPLLEWLKQEEKEVEDATTVSAATTGCTSSAVLTAEGSARTATTATASERTTRGPSPEAPSGPSPEASADVGHIETAGAGAGRSRSKASSGHTLRGGSGRPERGSATAVAAAPTMIDSRPTAVVMGRAPDGGLEAPSRSGLSLHAVFRIACRDSASGRGGTLSSADEEEALPPIKSEAGMRALGRDLKGELEKHHEDFFALRSSHRYVAGLLFFGLQPWLSLYRFSIFESAMARTLHLTAEVFGAMMFAALFFGLDALHVTSPSGCDDSGSWAREAWSELVAALLGVLLALIPAYILKWLGRRDFLELSDLSAIELQLWWWRIMDAVMWTFGIVYIAFAAFFTILFLSNTTVDSGLRFVAASLVEEAIVVMLVPATVTVAFLTLDATSELKEEDYVRTKVHLGLLVPQEQPPWKKEELRRSTISI